MRLSGGTASWSRQTRPMRDALLRAAVRQGQQRAVQMVGSKLQKRCQRPYVCILKARSSATCGALPAGKRLSARQPPTFLTAQNRQGRRITTASNKGMKQTSVEHIGRSQLIPSVGRTNCRATDRTRRCTTRPPTPAPLSWPRRPARGRRHSPLASSLPRLPGHPVSLSSEAHVRRS
jgi:hypothetical protein